jgi:hypothetical protein
MATRDGWSPASSWSRKPYHKAELARKVRPVLDGGAPAACA